jgi:hypothetical protein
MRRKLCLLAVAAFAAVSAVLMFAFRGGDPRPAVQAVVNLPFRTVAETRSYDVVVYGGTPSGIMAAVAAAGQGLTAAVVTPETHLGGIVTSGLCFSDIGEAYLVSGLTRTFFEKTGASYGESSPAYAFEPHMAERVFNEMLADAGVDVFKNSRLKEMVGVRKDGARLVSLTTEDGGVFRGRVFIDSSYEGDLMAGAGVSHATGREGAEQYRESLAGVRPFDVFNNFIYKTPARSADGRLMASISAEEIPEPGQADRAIPAYNYQLCLTQDTGNMVPFDKPANYDPAQYEVLLQWLYVLKQSQGDRLLKITDIVSLGALPGRKYDANNGGPVSSDALGLNLGFPEVSYPERRVMTSRHKEYLQGLLFFATSDSRVPADLREDMQTWGLAADEFCDNGNWPYELYIRECRRMTGDYVLTQRDLTPRAAKPDAVGIGSYPIDSHNARRVMTKDGFVQNEGEMQKAVRPYEIPYRCLVPKNAEASNLLVTVCVSASHVAYSSLRIESQFMMLGHAAGLAASLAVGRNIPVQQVDIAALQTLLKAQGVVYSLD